MKKKNSRLVFGLLTLSLVLGVAFAAVSSVGLNIVGNAASDVHNLNVHFATGNPVIDKGELDCTVTAATDGLNATIDVSDLEKVNDSVTVTYTIENDEPDLSATLEVITAESSNSEYFTVSAALAEETITAGGNTTVAVTVTLIKVPIDEGDSSAEITVGISATPAQPE